MIKAEIKEVAVYQYDDWNDWNASFIDVTKINGLLFNKSHLIDFKYSKIILFFENCDKEDMFFVVNKIKNCKGDYAPILKNLGIPKVNIANRISIEMQVNKKLISCFFALFPEYLI